MVALIFLRYFDQCLQWVCDYRENNCCGNTQTRVDSRRMKQKANDGTPYFHDGNGARHRVNPRTNKTMQRREFGRVKLRVSEGAARVFESSEAQKFAPILDRIYLARRARNITQRQLAIECHCSPQLICDIEAGRRNGSEKILCRIARALRVNLSETIERKP
jgi:ribosome-binding protein aMBF1 (putative translation factor)